MLFNTSDFCKSLDFRILNQSKISSFDIRILNVMQNELFIFINSVWYLLYIITNNTWSKIILNSCLIFHILHQLTQVYPNHNTTKCFTIFGEKIIFSITAQNYLRKILVFFMILAMPLENSRFFNPPFPYIFVILKTTW